MKLFKYILPFINLIALKDTWKEQKSGNKLIIEPSRLVLKYRNDSIISVSKDLINKDNCLKIKWINMKESNLRIIDDKTLILYDNINTELFKRKNLFEINNHILVLYLFQIANAGMIGYTYYFLVMFINFVLNNSNKI
jgi:hypothetical protein